MDAYDDIKKPKKSSRIVGLIFTVIGLCFIVVGGTITYFTYDFMQNAELTTGQVIALETSTNDGSTTYQPTFSYIAIDGSKQQGETFLASSTYDFAIGSKKEIYYDRRDYSAIRMTGWFDTWGFGILFTISGIVPLLIGLFIRRLGKQKTARLPRRSPNRRPEKYVQMESTETEAEHAQEKTHKPAVRRL